MKLKLRVILALLLSALVGVCAAPRLGTSLAQNVTTAALELANTFQQLCTFLNGISVGSGGAFTVDSNGNVVARSIMLSSPGPLVHAVYVVPYSAAPVLDMSQGDVQQFSCTTAAAAIVPTTASLVKGEEMVFIFVQNGTTACTLTYPGTMHGGTSPSATLNSIDVQKFVVSYNGSDLYAEGAASTGMTGGTP